MKYTVNYKDGAVCLPADAFLSCRTLQEARLLMLLSYDRSMGDAEEAVLAEQLGCTLEELEEVIASLRRSELLIPEKKVIPTAATKNLTGEEMATLLESDDDLKHLIPLCEDLCGKHLTPTEISQIVALKKERGFSGDTLLLMFSYYAEKLAAVGRKLRVSYVEKAAYSLYNQNVRTHEAMEAYIREEEERNSLAFRFRKLFGMGDRKFTAKETRFFEKWTREWQMPFVLIEYAFDIAVDATGKPSLEYMSKILSDWHTGGITTVEQAEKAGESFRQGKTAYQTKFKERPAETDTGSSFNTEDFFEKALRRSYAMMHADVGDDNREGDGT
ncbi:MAG: DnaD domain protein [Ruminococcaceae bacterium]|nr:DnaD domain protein [Oscillospiraceae bacterium]